MRTATIIFLVIAALVLLKGWKKKRDKRKLCGTIK